MWIHKTPGIPDELFLQSENVPGPTKEEIRVLTVSKARLSEGSIVVDVGCGTGGLTVEAALQVAPKGKVFAFDEDELVFFDADEGQAFGIGNYRVDDGAGLARALELATRIAGNAPLSNYAITQALPRIADLPHGDGLFMESLISSIAQGDDAAKERVRAFLEKRAAKVAKA